MSGTARKTIVVESIQAGVAQYEADAFSVDDGVLSIRRLGSTIAVHPDGLWSRVFVEEQGSRGVKAA